MWISTDPLQEKYPNISTYAYCSLNPVKYIDPDGRDYIVNFERDKNGKLIGLKIQAKVFIKGIHASQARAEALNKLAPYVYKSQAVDGVNVSFDISYEYNENITKDQLGKGENILTFSDKQSTSEDRSHVESITKEREGRAYLRLTGNIGEVYEGDGNNVVMHETGHFLGLADRYEDLDGLNLGGRGTSIHKGYENDLMSSGWVNTKLDKSHYQHYLQTYGRAAKNLRSITGRIMVSYGMGQFKLKLLSPYEKGGYHKKHPFAKQER